MPSRFEVEYHVKNSEELKLLEDRMELLFQHVSLIKRLLESKSDHSYELEVYNDNNSSQVIIDPGCFSLDLNYKSRNLEGKLVDLEINHDDDQGINVRINEYEYFIRVPERHYIC